jgi:hypothetical protein
MTENQVWNRMWAFSALLAFVVGGVFTGLAFSCDIRHLGIGLSALLLSFAICVLSLPGPDGRRMGKTVRRS